MIIMITDIGYSFGLRKGYSTMATVVGKVETQHENMIVSFELKVESILMR